MARDVTIVLKAQDQYSSTLQQFNKDVGNISKTTEGLSESGTKANGMMSGFVNNLNAAAIGFLGWKGAQLVSDITNLGTEANKAKQVFEALTRPMGGYTDNIEALRKATGGVVDNMTLMEGASKLVQMGLAANTTELSSMYEMAVKLGSSMGMDVTKSLSDFSLMLANNSIMRLDQFGISSGRVKDRMDDLKEEFEDMSKSDRFKLAVLEEGRAALDRLGGAAEAAETPLARIGATIANMGQDFAGDFSTGVNALAGILEIAMGTNPIQVALREAAEADANAYAQSFHDALGSEFQALGVADMLLASAFGGQTANPGASITDIVQQAWSSLDYNDTVGTTDEDQQRMLAATYSMLEQKQAVEDMVTAQEENAATNDRVNAIMQEQLGIQAAQTAEQETYQRNLTAIQQLESEDLVRQELKRQSQQSYSKDLLSISNALSNAYETSGFSFNPQKMGGDLTSGALNMPKFMTRTEADAIAEAYGEIQSEMARIKELADKDLITKEQLAAAEQMGSNLEFMASEADKAAEAFENMKLSDVFGQGGGGMQGEMSDMILQQMKAGGASPEAIAAMQRQLDLTSGRETDSSLMMQEQIAPMLAGLSPNQAGTQLGNYNALFQQGALKGMSQEQIMQAMMGLMGMEDKGIDMSGGMDNFLTMMSGTTLTQPGSGMGGAGSIFDDEKGRNKPGGKTLADTTTTMKGDMTAINKDATNVSKSFDAMQDSTTIISGFMNKIKAAVEAIEGTKDVKFRITADDPNNILSTIQQVMGGGSLEEIVRNNGGSVPGATGNHAGQGGR